jgi:hypothetical protein
MTRNIFINKKQWLYFNNEELEDYIDSVFTYYKDRGFPYFPVDTKYRDSEFIKLKKYVTKNTVISGNIIKQTMHGLGLCWSYFPHCYHVRCNGRLTPFEAFDNNEIFRKVITRRIKMGDNMSDSGLRKMLKIFTNVQGVSNFRPTAAASIYQHISHHFNNDSKIKTWDMSGGYGGRLFGAITSGVVSEYYATEPCDLTYQGLKEICSRYKPEWDENIIKCGSEDFEKQDVFKENHFDLCFTSPPYFDTEHYSNEDTQSYIKYPTKKDWLYNFLMKTVDNCYKSLRNEGLLMLNIASVISYKNLVDDFIEVMGNKNEWIRIDDMQLALSSISKKDKYKYEPILIFKKSCV